MGVASRTREASGEAAHSKPTSSAGRMSLANGPSTRPPRSADLRAPGIGQFRSSPSESTLYPAIAKAYLGDTGRDGWRTADEALGLSPPSRTWRATAAIRWLRRPARNFVDPPRAGREPGEEFDTLAAIEGRIRHRDGPRPERSCNRRYAGRGQHHLFIASFDHSGPIGYIALNENTRRGLRSDASWISSFRRNRPDVATWTPGAGARGVGGARRRPDQSPRPASEDPADRQPGPLRAPAAVSIARCVAVAAIRCSRRPRTRRPSWT